VQLHRALPQIRAGGAELHLVGNGNLRFGQAFRDEFAITSPVWIDTARETYKALGMKRGVASTLLASFRNRARAAKSGFRQGWVKGDAWQLGGVLVVRPGGEVAYRYLSDAAGDHPPVEELLAALRA
jgi:hypothetical protein